MSNYFLLVVVFAIALAVAYLLTPIFRSLARKLGVMSQPGPRSVHTKPIPYLGGLAIYFASLIAMLVAFYADQHFRTEFSEKLPGLLAGATLIVILGLWDDIRNIKAITKLSGQIVVAFVLFANGFRIELLTNPFGGEIEIPLFWSALITVIWIVGVVNALNLIDGLDGLASGVASIASLSLLFIALSLGNYITAFLLAGLAGASLGFLRFNFHPAKIFMGDTGSMFLGYILACAVLVEFQYKVATAVVLLIPIIALAIPIFDTSLAMLRRLLRKTPIFQADKKHLHHRLLDLGLSQQQVVLFIYLICAYFGVVAFLFVLIPKEYAVILLILLGMGVFMGARTIGFIERKMRAIHRMEKELSGNNS
ncbi:MAG: undecaprenyl/decaprenyl-phosphate alpha-N-acetylglucosaminyl 1-phosphate transferase [Candidatus Omnitrophica bacterium]|nr:undecaprenyl/decaprenyl-phosphate alpha-N-acetylglucosaminyl 1-phosphate transferase [Candidatus Omnitrophota bacterium]